MNTERTKKVASLGDLILMLNSKKIENTFREEKPPPPPPPTDEIVVEDDEEIEEEIEDTESDEDLEIFERGRDY